MLNTVVKRQIVKKVPDKLFDTQISYMFGANFPFNATLVSPPLFDKPNGLIELRMDGRFLNPKTNNTIVPAIITDVEEQRQTD